MYHNARTYERQILSLLWHIPFMCDGIFIDCYTKCEKSEYIFDIHSVQDSAFLLKFHDLFLDTVT
jgi:hypothetical protein